jgi:hypothetical protein
MTDADAAKTNGSEPAPGKDAKPPKKERKRRSTGRLAVAFVNSDTLEGQDIQKYSVLPDQPEFADQKAAKDYIRDLIENDAYAAEFAEKPIQIVRLVGEPMKVSKEVKTTVSFD